MDEYQALSHTTPVLRRCHVPASARITAFVCAADKPSNQASAFADTWSAGSCRAPLLRSVRTLSFPLRGAVLGIVVIQSISSGLTLLNLDSSVAFMITGVVLVLAVIVDSISRRTRAASGRA